MPLWAVRRLEHWSGMQASWAMTMPALLGPLARHVTNADPERFRSSVTGQANALLVNPHFETGRHRRIVLNPELSRGDRVLGAHTRVCHSLELESGRGRVLVANLHASNDPDPLLVGAEIDRAASFLAGDEPCVLCGDFNVRRHAVPASASRSTASTRCSCAASSSSAGPRPGPRSGAGRTGSSSRTTPRSRR